MSQQTEYDLWQPNRLRRRRKPLQLLAEKMVAAVPLVFALTVLYLALGYVLFAPRPWLMVRLENVGSRNLLVFGADPARPDEFNVTEIGPRQEKLLPLYRGPSTSDSFELGVLTFEEAQQLFVRVQGPSALARFEAFTALSSKHSLRIPSAGRSARVRLDDDLVPRVAP